MFCGKRKVVESTSAHLQNAGVSVGSLHGQMNQNCREEAILKFQNDGFNVLCATSVASRGLDFPSIEKVINFDMPSSIDVYTHRIGRTGRIGSSGIAISYFNHSSRSLARPLIQSLRTNDQIVPSWLNQIASKR